MSPPHTGNSSQLTWRMIGVMSTVLAISAGVSRADDLPLRQIGAAKIDITPVEPVLLSGYASRPLQGISKIEQRIYARAIAVGADDQHPAVLISVDNCGVPLAVREKVLAGLQEAGIRPERLTICSTHTHSAPMLTGVLENLYQQEIPADLRAGIDRYTKSLIAKLAEVALQALENRRPARLSYAVGSTDFANNRRTKGGPNDFDVPVLRVLDNQDKVMAIVVGYACHCTALPGVEYVCGDWAGYSSEYLEQQHPAAVALTIIGCGADQNPRVRGKLENAQQHGRSIADEVDRLLGGMMRPISADVACQYNEIEIAFDKHPSRAEWEAQADKTGIDGHLARKNLARLDRGEKLATSIPYPIQTWAFADDLAMVFLADEVVVDYSVRLKRELDARRVWVAAYTNDQRCYIPSERVLQEGGYEGGRAMIWYDWPTKFAPGLEAKIIAEVHRQVPDEFNAPGLPDAEAQANFQQAVKDIDPAKTGGIPPRSPFESLSTIVTHGDLQVELVAAEPLVVDPVAIDWAPDGSMWVVEMHDYPMGLDGEYSPGGRVKLLKDTDGDGRYDRSTVFVDGLPFPTGVTTWNQGVIICSAPDVIYAEDTDGDGRADIKETWLTGFETHNYQARVNSVSYGLDNWLYAAAGIFGGKAVLADGTVVDVSNRDFRFRPQDNLLEPVSGRTQQGRSRDDFGNWFGCRNGTLLFHYPATERYSSRNPLVASPPGEVSLNTAPLFPPAGLVTFEKTGPPGRATSACGMGLYRDHLLGEEYADNAFTCEPVNQLVHRTLAQPQGVTYASQRAPTELDREFLTATDNWFRPVQARTGPDGALYIVDMYRYVIEHPRFIPPEVLANLNTRAGDTMGRIYRVTNKSRPRRAVADLTHLDTAELVQELASPNGIRRDLVQHMLVSKGDKSAVPALTTLASQNTSAAVRLQALCTIDGLGGLTAEMITRALADSHPGIRRQALRLSESFLPQSVSVQQAVLQLVNDADAKVQLQLAYTLGEWPSPQSAQVLSQIALTGTSDVYLRSAVLSSVTADNLPVLLSRSLQVRKPSAAQQQLANSLLDFAARNTDPQQTEALLLQLLPEGEFQATGWQLQALGRVLGNTRSRQSAFSPTTRQRIDALRTQAGTMLANDKAAISERETAIRFYTAATSTAQTPAAVKHLANFLTPQQPARLRLAAIQALGELESTDAVAALLSAWPSLGPDQRTAGLDVLLSNRQKTTALLQALGDGRIALNEIDAARREQLLAHVDETIRQSAAKVFAASLNSDRQKVIESYRPQLGKGDAERGKAVFAKRCSVCHRLDGVGHIVGPDLAALTNKSPQALLVATLDPSRDVDRRYTAYTAVTLAGKTYNGVLAGESNNAVTLKAQEGKEFTILRADLDIFQSTNKSMMPDGLERDVTPQDLGDLFAYLGGNRGAKYRYAGKVKPSDAYADDETEPRLTNGAAGSGKFNDSQWIGLPAHRSADDLRIVFDLGGETKLSTVTLTYGVNHLPGHIHAPHEVRVAFSNDGKQFGQAWAFTGLNDQPDGLGMFEIARRTAQLKLPATAARYVQLSIANESYWTFLSEVQFNSPLGTAALEGRALSQSPTTSSASPSATPANTAQEIAALVAKVKVGTPDEYRLIPDIWRQAIAAGKRNQPEELKAVLALSLLQPEQPLRDWQAVVIGGGIINGITLAGDWPQERIAALIATDKQLQTRWHSSLQAAVNMADNQQVKSGTRYDALRMVSMLPWKDCRDQLLRYLAKGMPAELQQGAVSAVADARDQQAAEVLLAAIKNVPPAVRKFAIEGLLRTPERTRALLQALETGKLALTDIDEAAKQQLLEHDDPKLRQQAQRVLSKK